MDENKILRFAQLIKDSKNIVFFGGAGVSTESGMKDYRSEDGLYNTVKQYKVSPETILSRSFFGQHPDVFYDFYYNYFLNTTAEPNNMMALFASRNLSAKSLNLIIRHHGFAGGTVVLKYSTVEFDDVLTPRTLMKSIYILGNNCF